jgi:hypothetical protein
MLLSKFRILSWSVMYIRVLEIPEEGHSLKF